MILVQISDSHIEAPGVLTYDTFDAAASLGKIVEAINACDPQPTVVLHTGDLVHHGEAEQYPPARQILGQLQAPLYAIPGNHDRREGFAAAFADQAWMPKDSPFIQYTVEDFPVRLVCLDTVIPGSANGALCAERLAWLDSQLKAQPERPTIVACHHPPFATGLTGSTKVGLEEGGGEFAAILAKHAQVQRVICGHSHRPMLATFGHRPFWVAPGTCYQFEAGFSAANTLSLTREPPGYSMHRWLDDPIVGPNLVSHHIPVGDFGKPMVLLRNGKRAG